VEAREEQLTHLEHLARELDPVAFATEVIRSVSRPYLKVASASDPTLNERVYCAEAADGSLVFSWAWRQPVGSVDDLEMVTRRMIQDHPRVPQVRLDHHSVPASL
jgi:hypothetical protein